jgi:voltage-gated potassium channel
VPADWCPTGPPWRRRLHTIIFESDTPAGRAFDLVLIVAIAVGVIVVMLESVADFAARHGTLLRAAEWTLTALFGIEYLLRLATVARPMRYAVSMLGIIDLAAVLSGCSGSSCRAGQYLATVRVLRLLRIFRLLKLVEYTGEAGALARALQASRYRIGVFLFSTLTLVVIIGAVMFVVEGPEHGFTSVPRSMYWAIVTLTTVGYGDVSPKSDLGQVLASVVMLLGYGSSPSPPGSSPPS